MSMFTKIIEEAFKSKGWNYKVETTVEDVILSDFQSHSIVYNLRIFQAGSLIVLSAKLPYVLDDRTMPIIEKVLHEFNYKLPWGCFEINHKNSSLNYKVGFNCPSDVVFTESLLMVMLVDVFVGLDNYLPNIASHFEVKELLLAT